MFSTDNVYPRFAELRNQHGPVMKYVPFKTGEDSQSRTCAFLAVDVNHIVPTVGLLVSDGKSTVAL